MEAINYKLKTYELIIPVEILDNKEDKQQKSTKMTL